MPKPIPSKSHVEEIIALLWSIFWAILWANAAPAAALWIVGFFAFSGHLAAILSAVKEVGEESRE